MNACLLVAAALCILLQSTVYASVIESTREIDSKRLSPRCSGRGHCRDSLCNPSLDIRCDENWPCLCKCEPNYYTSDCSVFCDNANCSNAGVCNLMGRCDCLAGYAGANCSKDLRNPESLVCLGTGDKHNSTTLSAAEGTSGIKTTDSKRWNCPVRESPVVFPMVAVMVSIFVFLFLLVVLLKCAKDHMIKKERRQAVQAQAFVPSDRTNVYRHPYSSYGSAYAPLSTSEIPIDQPPPYSHGPQNGDTVIASNCPGTYSSAPLPRYNP
jgi:hypothetical protein